ncbi:hypothetical protein [Microcoleus sp. Pol17_C1]|uniref:hypothetical protein n=1 Tax=unclassified Microcoleus TaxID=2642155 RepID=UPI002FD6025B
MFRKHTTKNSSKSMWDVKKIHPLVIDLNEQSQESISGGQLFLQGEAEEERSAIALPSFLSQANKAKQ